MEITNSVLKPSINFPIQLCKTYNNLGQFTDTDFIPSTKDFVYVADHLREEGININKYKSDNYWIKGCTENKLDFVTSYIRTDKFKVNFNLSDDPQNCYTGVIANNTNSIVYVINGKSNNGVYIMGTGIIYTTYEDFKEVLFQDDCDSQTIEQRRTEFKVKINNSEDWTIKAQTHECYQLGLAATPNINNTVFYRTSNGFTTGTFFKIGRNI